MEIGGFNVKILPVNWAKYLSLQNKQSRHDSKPWGYSDLKQ